MRTIRIQVAEDKNPLDAIRARLRNSDVDIVDGELEIVSANGCTHLQAVPREVKQWLSDREYERTHSGHAVVQRAFSFAVTVPTRYGRW